MAGKGIVWRGRGWVWRIAMTLFILLIPAPIILLLIFQRFIVNGVRISGMK